MIDKYFCVIEDWIQEASNFWKLMSLGQVYTANINEYCSEFHYFYRNPEQFGWISGTADDFEDAKQKVIVGLKKMWIQNH